MDEAPYVPITRWEKLVSSASVSVGELLHPLMRGRHVQSNVHTEAVQLRGPKRGSARVLLPAYKPRVLGNGRDSILHSTDQTHERKVNHTR